MIPTPKKSKTDLPLHGAAPDLRPGEAFMAEQAAMVAPRRAAFERLALAREHVEHLPAMAPIAPPAEADDAPKPAEPVKLDAAVERPSPDYEMPALPFEKKKAAPESPGA